MSGHRRATLIGVAFAAAAGLMWGLVFVAPTWLAEYPAALLVAGRYLAFGLIALPLALYDRRHLTALTRADWLEALKLALVGNLLYYQFLAAAIQRAGGPLPTMIIGTLPVVIAVTANLRRGSPEGRLPWSKLVPSLLLIAAGLACVNQAEMAAMPADTDLGRYGSGALLAIVAVACWTWYPIRNAEWLRKHADRSPRVWATAQGVATLPLALLAYGLFWAVSVWTAGPSDSGSSSVVGPGAATADGAFPMPFGPRPADFVWMMLAIGLFASWLGTLCWNEASQRLPPALAGQLIVFETLAALGYAFLLRGHAPGWLTGVGAVLLVAGVVSALRVRPVPRAAAVVVAGAPQAPTPEDAGFR